MKLTDIIPGLDEKDVQPDTAGVSFVINADPNQIEQAGKARMFNLEQL